MSDIVETLNYKPYHYFVGQYEIEFPNAPTKTIKTLFATRDEERLYFGTSQQHTFRKYLNNLTILKDYGHSTSYENEQEIVKQYKRDFPMPPSDIETETVKDVDGWLSPTGTFYRCGWMGHSNMAVDLVDEMEIDRGMDDRYEDALYKLGWISVSHSMIMSGLFRAEVILPTDAQVAWLKRLAELNTEFDSYLGNIELFFERLSYADELKQKGTP